jgi:predicted RNase H-like HicB family nuclease
MRYPVVIHKDPGSDYGVTVPDLPGCFIECHIEGLMLGGEPIPPPSSIEFHQDNPDYANGVWAFVSVDFSKLSGKSRRVNITIPERLLAAVDAYAKRNGETRSGFIAQAALEFIANHSPAEG